MESAMGERMGECRVCSGRLGRRFATAVAEYGRCKTCGTINKLLTPDQYAALDPTYDPGDLIDADEADIARKLGVARKKSFLQRVCRRHGRPPAELSLLDVGCGAGGYLLAAQALGMRARGIEPSETHSRMGRQRFGLDITTGYFTADTTPDRFDIVILSHVIEHIYSPRGFMAELVQALKPGGVLVVITPNAANPIARLSGPNWSMLAPIDHVTMLGPKGVQRIAPEGYSCVWSTHETLWEPAATLLVTLRNSLRRPSAEEAETRNNAVARRSSGGILALPLVKPVLAAVSTPLWLVAGLLNNRACLTAEYRRAG